MKPVRSSTIGRLLLPLALLLPVLLCHAADGEFYQRFVQSFATNGVTLGFRFVDSALIDTNNTARKLTNDVFALSDLMTNGQVGRIHLGMSMDEVVAEWGKPRWL